MYRQSYDFVIIHGPGKDNVLTDTLSRIYEEQEASVKMILVNSTEKKNLKGPYSAMTSNTKNNLYLARILDPVAKQSLFSPTPLDPFSIPQQFSMWNTEDVLISDLPQTDENNNHPSSIK